MKLVNETEEKVKAIYNDVWKIYKEFLLNYDMAHFNNQVVELKKRYGNDKFLVDILWAFVPIVNTLRASCLMKQDGKIKEEC